MSFRYRALGLDIVSPFPCGGFWPVERAITGREITVDLGPVPENLDAPVCARPLLQIDAKGTALHHVPGVARYLIWKRSKVTIAVEPGASIERAVDFLKGTPLALLCRQWGLVPLDSVGLAWDGRALLLSGSAGCGKSTMALALAAQGFKLMSDGPCALEARPDDAPVIWPAFPQVRAWPDSLSALDHPLPGEPGPGRRHILAADPWFEPEPRPLMMIAVLHPARGGIAEQGVRRRGAAAFEKVMNLQMHADAMRGVEIGADQMKAIGSAVSRSSIYEIWYPYGFERLPSLPAWLIDRLGGANAAHRVPADRMRETSCA